MQDSAKVFYDEGEARDVNNEHQLTAYLEQEKKAKKNRRRSKKIAA
jgi:hypothetical protein